MSCGAEVTQIVPQEVKTLSWQASVAIVAIVIEMRVISSDDVLAQGVVEQTGDEVDRYRPRNAPGSWSIRQHIPCRRVLKL